MLLIFIPFWFHYVCLFQCTIICLPHMRKLPLFSVRYFLMCQSRVSLSSVRSFMRARTHTDWSHTLMSASEASSTLFCCRWALLETGLWSFIHTLLLPLGSSGNWTLEKWCWSLDWCCCKLLHVSQLYDAVQYWESLK